MQAEEVISIFREDEEEEEEEAEEETDYPILVSSTEGGVGDYVVNDVEGDDACGTMLDVERNSERGLRPSRTMKKVDRKRWKKIKARKK